MMDVRACSKCDGMGWCAERVRPNFTLMEHVTCSRCKGTGNDPGHLKKGKGLKNTIHKLAVKCLTYWKTKGGE